MGANHSGTFGSHDRMGAPTRIHLAAAYRHSLDAQSALTWAWIVERDSNPALRPLAGLVLHGLRATACVRLLRAGANTRQIAEMVGMSEQIVGRYCRFSVQRENASAAVLYLDRNRSERNRAKPENMGS